MAVSHPESLTSRIEQARRLALQRLFDIKSPEGTWEGTFDISAFESAVFIIMLRTTGLIERSELAREEVRLIRHMVHQANSDGGFYKYPGSPSSRSLSRLASFSLRMAIGEVHPANRPAHWFQRNPFLSDELLLEIRRTLERTNAFLQRNHPKTWSAFELPHAPVDNIIGAYLDPRKPFIHVPHFAPEFQAWLNRSRLFAKIHQRINFMYRKALPGISILCRAIEEQRPVYRALNSAFWSPKALRDFRSTAVAELSQCLLSSQNDSGSWSITPVYTMLNVMALRESGLSHNHSAIEVALSFLRGSIFQARKGGAFFTFARTDVWDTSLALVTILGVPGWTAEDKEVRPAVEFLLSSQEGSGGFSMSSLARLDTDVDSTALALRALSRASMTARGELSTAIARALRQGLTFLLSHQYRRGGYSAFDVSLFKKGRRGAHGLFLQALFDSPTADLTARVLFALIELGKTAHDEPVQRGLRFLLRNQCRNGAWWSRWWAGYISGTDFALDTLGRLGFCYGPNPDGGNELMFKVHEAMMKAISFLLQRQNADGGWGETVWSDFSIRHAGRGKSKPLHTASVLFDLLFCGYPVDSTPINRGFEFLLGSMTPEGLWEDSQVNFTVIPRAQYYSYPFLNYILPLNALNAYLKAVGLDYPQKEMNAPCDHHELQEKSEHDREIET